MKYNKEYYYDEWRVIILKSSHEGYFLVVWEDAHGDSGADILTQEEIYNKYPWIKDKTSPITHDGWNGLIKYDITDRDEEKWWTCICGHEFSEHTAVVDRNLTERCPKCDTALGGSPE